MGLGTSLGVQAEVPPAEAGGVVANELLVVKVVVLGAGPEGEEVAQAPGEVVAAVGVDGLEESQDDPDVHGEEVELASDLEEDDGAAHDTNAEEGGFDGGGVLSGETEGGGVGVVHLVDSLVERAVVQGAVEPVVPGILHDKADGDLEGHLPGGREGHVVVHAEVGGDGVEEPDLGKLGGEVADEDDGGAVPLLLQGGNLLSLDLVAVEEGDEVHDHVGNAAAEVDELVEDEAHDSGREGVVLHVNVPGLSRMLVSFVWAHGGKGGIGSTYGPELLEEIKLDIVL